MTLWWILAGALLLAATGELLTAWLVHFLRKDFQWLITSADELPVLNHTALKKFFASGFDPELGWVRKANTSSTESTGSAGALSGHQYRVPYRIDHRGARDNPSHQHLSAVISTYGDSFVFCRHVRDSETWQWYLSELTQTDVLNFGVGNYGVDQALLRLKREYDRNRTDIVIMGAVPETLVRILSVWKHYCEYGNTFGFKPRYLASPRGLTLVPNVMDREEKFYDLARYLPEVQKHDFFYETKFTRAMLRFPYLVAVLRQAGRNIPLLSALVQRKLYAAFGRQYDRPWELILRENQNLCVELYRNDAAVDLLLRIVGEFVNYAEVKRFTPVFLLMPYQHDLEYVRRFGTKYYQEFYRRASKMLVTIDMTESLLNVREPIYTNDFYGGHLNALGNRLVAGTLAQELSTVLLSSARPSTLV